MVEQAVITEDEAALYDRQIRLWGLDAQRRLGSFIFIFQLTISQLKKYQRHATISDKIFRISRTTIDLPS